MTMVLPNDHLTDEHPADGYPFRESYMADNDLALGRVMQTLSHSPLVDGHAGHRRPRTIRRAAATTSTRTGRS